MFTILIIDDEAAILRSLKMELRSSYNILTAQTFSQAMDRLYQEKIHIIICDEKMPEMKGSELLEKIKLEFPETIRILLSGYTDLNSLQTAINRANVFKFIAKPWNPDELKTILAAACRQRTEIIDNQYIDHLTQLKSEASLRDLLIREFSRCKRYKHGLSCIMIDILNLKVINDLLGYHIGDMVIKQVAKILVQELRNSDYAGRLQDDNFLVLLPETGENGTKVFIDRYLENLYKEPLIVDSRTVPFEVNHASMSVSETFSGNAEAILQTLEQRLKQASTS